MRGAPGVAPGVARAVAVVAAAAVVLPRPGSAQDPRDAGAGARGPGEARPVVVASKPFAESYLLAEIFARHLENRGFRVDRRPGLGATEITFGALRRGAVDVYPEYTGTGLLAILGDTVPTGPGATYRRVAERFADRWGVRWLPPLGFENTYAIAVRRETARRYGLRTLSDLAGPDTALVGGFSPDFLGRDDGLPGLREAYGLDLRGVRSLLQAVKYEALSAGEVDVIDGYSTDGMLARRDLEVLEDDRGFFPPYEAAALVSRRLWTGRPEAVRALVELSGRLTEERMRELNARVEVEGEPVARVAARALRWMGVEESGGSGEEGVAPPPRATSREAGSLAGYLWARRGEIAVLARRHLLLVGISLAAAVLLAVPLGLALERARATAETTIRGAGVLQTIPSIALLAFMIPLLGIGVVPALVALFLYSLYPILRNTYTGVRDAPPEAVGAARALGMTEGQILRHVRLPLAAPVIMAGVRTAAVINVGTATLAAFIGAGGLGDPIVSGLALSDTRMILSGAIPAALLAVAVDGLLAVTERLVAPGGIEE